MRKRSVQERLTQWQEGFMCGRRETKSTMQKGIIFLLILLEFVSLIPNHSLFIVMMAQFISRYVKCGFAL